MAGLLNLIDCMLISMYRFSGHPVADYFIGTFLLALLAVVLGELTISIVFKVNRKHIDRLNNRLMDTHNLSMQAWENGDKQSYSACNQEANDAFGRVFFNMVGLSAAALWPVFFALAWMQLRFLDVRFPVPFTGWSVNYVVTFLVCYIAVRMAFGLVKTHLPYFKGVSRLLQTYEEESERMSSATPPPR
ncbi:MAG: hypothetical protein AB1426_10725 [Bacillota bacterium]